MRARAHVVSCCGFDQYFKKDTSVLDNVRQSNPSELLYSLCARGWIETLLVRMLLLLALVLTLPQIRLPNGALAHVALNSNWVPTQYDPHPRATQQYWPLSHPGLRRNKLQRTA